MCYSWSGTADKQRLLSRLIPCIVGEGINDIVCAHHVYVIQLQRGARQGATWAGSRVFLESRRPLRSDFGNHRLTVVPMSSRFDAA